MNDKRDRRLMRDMLRYPATLFFRDEQLAIIQPNGQESYEFWTPVVKVSSWSHKRDFTNTYIVRSNSKEYFEVTKSAGHMTGGKFTFGKSAYLDAHVPKGEFATVKTYERTISEWLKKYPSLLDAFGEMAEKMAFLPMIPNQTDEIIWEALNSDLSNIQYIDNLTHKGKLAILRRWPSCIKAMGQTQELCDFVVKQDGGNISYIDESFRNQKLCERAVQDYSPALRYVVNQTEKICLLAIKRDAMSLQYIKNPTMKMYVAAVNRSPNAWNLIKKEKLRKEIKKAKKQKKYRS